MITARHSRMSNTSVSWYTCFFFTNSLTYMYVVVIGNVCVTLNNLHVVRGPVQMDFLVVLGDGGLDIVFYWCMCV